MFKWLKKFPWHRKAGEPAPDAEHFAVIYAGPDWYERTEHDEPQTGTVYDSPGLMYEQDKTIDCDLSATEVRTVGRGREECDIVLEIQTISRIHCEIQRIGRDAYRIRDLGSHNGTFVNGIRIDREWRQLEAGDRLRIADYTCVFNQKDDALSTLSFD